jgi:glyoxylase-like metal-dependent hydrolase (beta-lactamase superfamily II)
MIVRATLSTGRRIYGFATKNLYGEDWDIGPTWNYLVTADRPFLVDSGRRGKGEQLLKMIESVGFSRNDIEAVILSHSHEDHDGGLFEIAAAVPVRVMGHEIYRCMVQIYPDAAPALYKAQVPASCWRCPLPESFLKSNCLDYHGERRELAITAIGLDGSPPPGVKVFHTPGHSPDAISLLVDDEALLAGDTILPELTPHPTAERDFFLLKAALPVEWKEAQQLFGLRAYVRSLKKLKAALGPLDPLVLPAHRLYYRDNLNHIDLSVRIEELVQHHIDRCSSFGRIVRAAPKTVREIAEEYFHPGLLKGYGIYLAVNEVRSHVELMEISRDAVVVEGGKVMSNGTENFRSLIRDIG